MPAAKLNGYLVTGGRFHDTDFARLELLKLLGEKPNIRTKVGNDYSDIDGIAASDFLITYTCDVLPTSDQVAALRRWVENGGRWFALHGTNSILRLIGTEGCRCPDDEQPEFFELLGTQFKAHPLIEAYSIDVVDPDHEMTRGIESFETIDEQYLSVPKSPITVLMETRFAGDAPGFVDHEHWEDGTHPVLYTKTVGAGEILYLTLGHCRGHYDLEPIADYNPIVERCSWNMPVYYELLRRGIGWAMP
jgi:type 1 glutamine amidotransferase